MKPLLYGVMGRFETPEALLDAIRTLRRENPDLRLEAFAPYAVEGLTEALALPPSRIPLITLAGGLVGGLGGFFMQWYAAVVSFPENIGGRPLNSWPMFIPVTFEMAVLCAALAAVFGMLLSNGLPRIYHPVFNTPHFGLATRDRYFLCVRSGPAGTDKINTEHWTRVLTQLGAQTPVEVWS
ncbi:DUF3341 domain-containing protein [Eoetvoesiella caeni]|uniref:Quinol:cytochrome c oxidoreductase membrane protein n=1 Tax=Eoetvoesiella caeni TaxID=645616 RepID=A0A366H231_9BURK|nr:DUF3341 domain-containing protein [Eoetvoesiella caeni]MCI2810788.1 DUF3341 domain-containing protein [Eoetvoesiella caeni]NYT56686.1 DUF3341 domain-containing protein [Eoetvoesiella caeni]RBP35806.1 quinol:cytochrome c oxidoreductase membrane protein [Eoetvoesiella caeni]